MKESNDKKTSPKSSLSENSRRKALKALTLGTGAVVAGQWSKPIVESVILPAHARTSVLALAAGGASASAAGSATTPPP